MYLGNLVELANRNELYERLRHPYTAALMSAVRLRLPGAPRRAGSRPHIGRRSSAWHVRQPAADQMRPAPRVAPSRAAE
jgi:ABC-type oligopeptide transport system ATPase subunit